MAGRIGCADTKDLDRPVWTSLTQGLSNIAQGTSGALRILPDYGQFAASADLTPENLAALGRLTASGEIWLLERKPLPPVPGATVVSQGEYLQMILSDPMRPEEDRSVTMLGDADAEEMRRLAELTNPGPFYPRSHQLGQFIGIRDEGKLIAMAGERLTPGLFTEISGVCTHPDYRGRGLAGGLTRSIASAIAARGRVPFLHCSLQKPATIALYQSLGFRPHEVIELTVLKAAG